MSKILALDSSTDACSAALHLDGQIISRFEIASKSHTQRLLPLVDELLREQSLALSDLDALAFGRGPGSFTGLRICMGVVQGLAFGANLPVVPVSTLAAMALAYWSRAESSKQPVMPALDARMDEVYWCLYEQSGNGMPQPLVPEQVTRPELVSLTDIQQQSRFAAVGSGWNYPSLAGLGPVETLVEWVPDAAYIARIAAADFAKTGGMSINDVQPVYLRDSVSWKKRDRLRTTPIPGLDI